MGIQFKLILPNILVFLVFALILQIYWAPTLIKDEKNNFIHLIESELAIMETDLTFHLLSNDYAAINSSLDHHQSTHNDTWKQLSLHNNHGTRVYPVIMGKSYEADEFTIPISYTVGIENQSLGKIEILLDWRKHHDDAQKRIYELFQYLIILLIILFIFSIFWQNKLIRFPLIELQKASDRLVKVILKHAYLTPEKMKLVN